MSLVPATFRKTFPEFSDPNVYSDGVIEFWDGIALTLLDPTRWGAMLVYGESLLVAHHLAIATRNRAVADAGGVAGEVKGPVTAKGIDKVTVSYDAQAVSLENQGFYGMTSYGIEFLQLAEQMGSGGNQF